MSANNGGAVEMELQEVLDKLPALRELQRFARGDEPVPGQKRDWMGFAASLNYRIAGNVKQVQDALKRFNEERKKVMEKYAVPVDTADESEWAKENAKAWADFKKEMEDLGKEKVKFEFAPIAIPPDVEGLAVEVFTAWGSFLSIREAGGKVLGKAARRSRKHNKAAQG